MRHPTCLAGAWVVAGALGWTLAAHGSQPTLLWDHGSHTRPSPGERALRDRVNVLRLTAALQLDASLALTAVDPVGWHILDAERAIDLLHALRKDFARSGPVPWPIAVNEPWHSVERGRDTPRSGD